MVEDIIVGRDRKDLAELGKAGTAFIGKHIVGKGEDSHLTNPIMMDLTRPHVMLVCGKRGSGKCVEENTLVHVDDGRLVPIKELEEHDYNVSGLDRSLKCSRLERTDFFKRRVSRLVHVRTRSGREIKLTPEHPLLTIKGWKEVSELGIGSRIATPREQPFFGKESPEEHRVKLLAYLIAEGHMRNNFVLFSNSDDEICRDFFQSVRLFDSGLKISEHSKPGCYRVTRKNRKNDHSGVIRDSGGRFAKGSVSKQIKSPLSSWLHDLGIYGLLSKERVIPDIVFMLDRKPLSLFLNRLFSCDGSIYKHKAGDGFVWEISYSTSSETMARQVSHLLLRFGILSRTRKKRVRCNGKLFDTLELVIGTDNAVKFVREIGFFGEKTKRIPMLLKHSKSKESNPNVDTIPREIWDVYRPGNWAEIGRAMGYTTPKALRSSISYSPSREKLAQIAMLDSNDVIRQIATSDIFWDEVVSMEILDGDFTVCDITVPGLHNFAANDIIVHNSYSAGVVAEELTLLPKEIKENLAVLMIDTMGIYWSMKRPNEKERERLEKWGLEPKAMEMKFFIPKGYVEEYKEAGIEYDHPFTLPCGEMSASDWIITFGFKPMDDHGILIERAVKSVAKRFGSAYSIDDIIKEVTSDQKGDRRVKDAVTSRFEAAKEWGIFEKSATPIETFFSPGAISVIDISHYARSGAGWSVRSMVIGLFAKKIFQARLMARKSEELEVITGERKKSLPMVWVIIDEAHQFLPSEGVTAASDGLHTLIKEGREPGISLLLITQIPNKLHPDALAQSDMVIAHRLTSEGDMKALQGIMQTYMLDDIMTKINELPRDKGTAIILDDNSERLYTMQIRPRMSWHAGGSPRAIKKKSIFEE